ncbi:PTS cellobiose transporter subunit IIC [Alloscardovia macacae]|uniref:PTS cellobiose transporter subunit IIC n=1 Tax=Alloscardovia macacae TaxID=1160091 RepID=A0A1Y2SWR4_9BIFI|nr:GtrA family protein [Alloscardovia macacae]OTA26805.1 PTS cellobiose transporter subunit IIC [Alloscardovia macacae]OTA29171.1 PTS cellobiose transporter subunit IIC [Alloscardovia macacae]
MSNTAATSATASEATASEQLGAETAQKAQKAEKTDKEKSAFQRWIAEHPDLWEFILFNILSNVSTASRFAVLWSLTPLFVNVLHMTTPFHFAFYNYDAAAGGLGVFLATILAEIVAQAVNFFVQMKWVFKSDSNFKDAAWKYVVLSILLIIVSGFAPSYITAWANGAGFGGIASTLTAVFNTMLAVVVSYPLLKFWIMPKTK